MTNVINLNSYRVTGKEKVLLDANILLYLFGPFNGANDYGYSNFLEKALINGTEMYVNESVISEFINRNCRLAYEQYLRNNTLKRYDFSYKKHYRTTENFKRNYNLSIDIVKTEILTIAKFSSNCNKEMNKGLLSAELLDFNDELIVRNAECNGLGIVTHDRDFITHSSSIDVFQYS